MSIEPIAKTLQMITGNTTRMKELLSNEHINSVAGKEVLLKHAETVRTLADWLVQHVSDYVGG